jgi:DNA-binding transcriptional ArsR family regulator
MEIDRKTLKALAADTRLDILKSLGKRRKMPSELSKELNLAVPTVTEHLERLAEADLIRREETGHKWVYYNLTEKGESLVRPRIPVQFIIVLSISILIISAGFIYVNYGSGTLAASAPSSYDSGRLAQSNKVMTTETIANETNTTNSTEINP